MAVTFPRAGFFDLARPAIGGSPFKLRRRQETSRTAGGQTLGKDLGPALWTFDLVTVPVRRPASRAPQAFLESLDGVIGSILLHDPTRPLPASDPSGAADLSGVTVSAASGQTLTLAGLPAGFALTPGDLLGVTVAGRRHLYEVAEAAVASGAGAAAFDVSPELRPGVAAGLAVTLVRPEAEFQVTSWTATPRDGLFLSFAIQGIEL